MVKFINAKFDFNKKVSFSFSRVIFFIIAIFSFGLTIGVVLYSAKNRSSEIIQPQASIAPATDTPTLSPTVAPVSDNIADWKTYKNEKADFYLNYPEEWGPVKTEEFRKSIAGKGEEFYTIFTNNNFTISGNTADFEPYENPLPAYLGGDSSNYCKDLEKQVFSIVGCEKINENISAISYGFYPGEGMFGSGKEISFRRQTFINNELNKYAAITISFKFPDYSDSRLVDMNEEQIRDIAKSQLAEIDKKAIDFFDQIISTFKFIDKNAETSAINETDLLGYWFTPHAAARNLTLLKNNQFKFNDGKKMSYTGEFAASGFIVTLKFSDEKMKDIILKFSADRNVKYLENNEGELFVKQ